MSEGIVVFDIIGTCFSLGKLRQQLIQLGAPDYALELWFSQSLRDAFAFSHAGGYQPLKEILQAQLPRTLKTFKIEPNSAQLSRIIDTFSQLELQPGAKEAFEVLTATGWQIIALTNGSEAATCQLLKSAGVEPYFSKVYSCDAIARTKPHPDVYQMIPTEGIKNVWLVAAHAWDIAGAQLAGIKTAFVKHLEHDYLAVYPQPEIIVENLLEAAHQIIDASH